MTLNYRDYLGWTSTNSLESLKRALRPEREAEREGEWERLSPKTATSAHVHGISASLWSLLLKCLP